MAITILAIGLFIFAAFLFKGVFDRTGIPDVLLLMVCGIVIGPLTGWVVPEAFGQAGSVLATLALVIILFESGVDLELSSLRPSLSATLKISLVTFSATAAIVTSVGIAIAGLPPLSALMLGAILGGTSSAVVIPLVQSLNVQGKARTVMVLESALTDVLCIVGLFMLVDAAKKGATSPAHVAISLSETLFFAAGIGIVAGIAWLLLLRTARRMPHGSFASTAMCCVIYGLTEMAGLSGAIAAITFGLVLANGRKLARATRLIRPGRLAAFSSREQGFLQELIFVLKTFFFVYLGLSMKLDNPSIFTIAALIVLLVYFARHFFAGLFCDRDITREHVALTAIMVPKGLAAAVLAGIPLQQGVAGGETIQALAYAVVLLSITLTATLIALQRFMPVRRLYGKLYRRFADPAEPVR